MKPLYYFEPVRSGDWNNYSSNKNDQQSSEIPETSFFRVAVELRGSEQYLFQPRFIVQSDCAPVRATAAPYSSRLADRVESNLLRGRREHSNIFSTPDPMPPTSHHRERTQHAGDQIDAQQGKIRVGPADLLTVDRRSTCRQGRETKKRAPPIQTTGHDCRICIHQIDDALSLAQLLPYVTQKMDRQRTDSSVSICQDNLGKPLAVGHIFCVNVTYERKVGNHAPADW